MKLAAMEAASTVTAQLDGYFLPNSKVAFIQDKDWIKANDAFNITLQGHFAIGCAMAGIDIVRDNGQKRGLTFLAKAADDLTKETRTNPAVYLALGELKGGIDPAGADEHWKTARTALTRIQASFSASNLFPKLFFVGAAIEKKMATEIWKLLEDDNLDNAANLTDENQVASVSSWLCNL